MNKITRILLTFFSFTILFGQDAEKFKRFMDTYEKIKIDQEANDVVKKGIADEDGSDKGPVLLLVEPGDVTKYYREKMNSIQNDLMQLNRLLIDSDSIPPLTTYGYNYFSLRDSIQFIDNANVSSNYILGYGDEVIISVWGQAEQYEKKILERDGTVFIDNVGLLYLGGKTQKDAKIYLQERFSKVYASLNASPQLTYLEFSIGRIKNINISVAGHVQYPGNYVVNPSISISNILILAGGVTNKGTLRNITVQRNNSVIDTLDLYPLITGIGIIDQIPIFDGDIIIVPPKSANIAVTGNVLSPAYFEIKSGESILELLEYAGKVNNINNIIISRESNDNLYLEKSQFDNTKLMAGDSLIVPIKYNSKKSISVSITNRPVINIPWIKNLTFNQILNIVSVNIDNIEQVELIRRNNTLNNKESYSFELSNSDEFLFFSNDYLSIHLYETFSPLSRVVIKGQVNSPGTYALINDQESLKSLINRAGGFQGSASIKHVSVKRDTLEFGSETGELVIAHGDTIKVNPISETVKVEGEVHWPGLFEWTKDSRVKQYIIYAGGLTSYGDKSHIVYITPYGKALKISANSNKLILPGSTIRISEKPISEQNIRPDRFQQVSSIITSLVTIAILANSTK
jgi:protein involved in polysaccharide export with SLBB domain